MNKDHIINYYPNIKARCYLVAQGLVQVALAHRENHSFSGGVAQMFFFQSVASKLVKQRKCKVTSEDKAEINN